MRIEYCSNYRHMSQKGADIVLDCLKENSKSLICAATGNSPTGLYKELVSVAKLDKDLFNNLQLVKLDEWGDIKHNSLGTCERYLNEKLIEPLQISSSRQISFRSDAINPHDECEKIQKELKEKGTIELCILGLGKNGHLGFNEPGNELHPHCHVAELSAQSIQHEMIQRLMDKPTFGMTLGMSDILSAKRIILLVSGAEKERALKRLLSGKITTSCPATFLQLHANVDCLIDEGALTSK